MSLPCDAGASLGLQPGRLYRAGVLLHHDGALIAPARTLGIRHVLDLRSSAERERELNLWGALLGVRSQHLPIATDIRADAAATQALIARFAHAPDANAAHALMRALYRSFADAFLPHLRALFAPVAAGEPLLLHCTAGKDRTGFAVALLALASGCSLARVRADYLARGRQTANAGQRDRLAAMLGAWLGTPADDAVLATLGGVAPDYLDAALDTVATRYGSLNGYLDAAGVDAAQRQAVARALRRVNALR